MDLFGKSSSTNNARFGTDSISTLLVDLMQQRLAVQKTLQVFANQVVVAIPESFGHSGCVGSDEKIVERPEG